KSPTSLETSLLTFAVRLPSLSTRLAELTAAAACSREWPSQWGQSSDRCPTATDTPVCLLLPTEALQHRSPVHRATGAKLVRPGPELAARLPTGAAYPAGR